MFMILLIQALLLTDLTASLHNILSSGFVRVFLWSVLVSLSIVALSYLHIIGYEVAYTIL